jgi:hypothetical protein
MDPLKSPLLTDLYQLTMLQAYYEQEHDRARRCSSSSCASFRRGASSWSPRASSRRSSSSRALRFGPEELEWIDSLRALRPGLRRAPLSRWRFTGDIHAMPEGTVFFPDEPILRVTAPMPEAQLLETRLLNLVHFETLIATKAAHVRRAAPGKRLIDFGLRRAHGAEAGLLAARASWIAGFDGTATALAAPRFGIPVFGTMAHSFVQAHDSEAEAFAHFAAAFPENAVLLVDTYDTVEGARRRGCATPGRLKGVRLDSGDLEDLARRCGASWTRRAPRGDDLRERQPRRGASRRSSRRGRPSTASASARASPPRPTRRTSTRCTSCRSTPGGRGASAPPARRPGRAASRSGARWTPRAASSATRLARGRRALGRAAARAGDARRPAPRSACARRVAQPLPRRPRAAAGARGGGRAGAQAARRGSRSRHAVAARHLTKVKRRRGISLNLGP